MSELEIRDAMRGLGGSANGVMSAEKVAEDFRADFEAVGKLYRDAMGDIRKQMELNLNTPASVKDARTVFGESDWKSNRIAVGGNRHYSLVSVISLTPLLVAHVFSLLCSESADFIASFNVAAFISSSLFISAILLGNEWRIILYIITGMVMLVINNVIPSISNTESMPFFNITDEKIDASMVNRSIFLPVFEKNELLT